METVRWLIVIIIYFVISEVIMLKIEKKIVDIQAFVLPKINPDSEHLLLSVILTDNNIDILKYYFDHSKYRWLTGENVTDVDEYDVGNILFLYERCMYFCKFRLQVYKLCVLMQLLKSMPL